MHCVVISKWNEQNDVLRKKISEIVKCIAWWQSRQWIQVTSRQCNRVSSKVIKKVIYAYFWCEYGVVISKTLSNHWRWWRTADAIKSLAFPILATFPDGKSIFGDSAKNMSKLWLSKERFPATFFWAFWSVNNAKDLVADYFTCRQIFAVRQSRSQNKCNEQDYMRSYQWSKEWEQHEILKRWAWNTQVADPVGY